MNRIRALGVIGLVGAVALMGCPQGDSGLKNDVEQLKKDVQDLKDEKQTLREYLKEGGLLYNHMMAQSVAICELEKAVGGIDPDKRICPGSPPDIKAPPAYPPK
jgi:hypothetical protein